MDTIKLLSTMIGILSNFAVVITLVIAIFQLRNTKRTWQINRTRVVRQATMDCYNRINKETKDLIDMVIVHEKKLTLSKIKKRQKLHRKVRRYLSLMERFSVGIRSHIYDLEVFDRIHGKTTVIMYKALEEYIDYVKCTKGDYFYCDFEYIVMRLKELRSERNDRYSPNFLEATTPLS